MASVQDVLQTASTHMNDWNQTFWTKEPLINFLREAHRELQVELSLHGIPVLNNVSAILTVPANTKTLSISTTPALPNNVIVPIQLWERATGSTDDFDDMIQKSWEPEIQPLSELVYWAWRGENIDFVGATTSRDVKIYYKGGITLPIADADQMGFIFAELYIAPRLAALALRSVGGIKSRGYIELSQIASDRLSKVIRMNVKAQQSLPTRRRGYRRRLLARR